MLRILSAVIRINVRRASQNAYIKEYLKKYEHDDKLRVNDEHGKQRKLASLRSVYQYFTGLEKIPEDPAADVTLKKAPEHIITYLQPNEVAILLDCIAGGLSRYAGIQLERPLKDGHDYMRAVLNNEIEIFTWDK